MHELFADILFADPDEFREGSDIAIDDEDESFEEDWQEEIIEEIDPPKKVTPNNNKPYIKVLSRGMHEDGTQQ